MILDLFAGPGGWSTGLRWLSPDLHATELGVEWDRDACLTRVAAGHTAVQADVTSLPYKLMAGVAGVIASPPCQAWSTAGKRLGLKDQPRVIEHALSVVAGWHDYGTGWHDDRSPLVLEPLRAVWGLRPEWVACEQVPDVAGLWAVYARLLRGWGYSAWSGVLQAETYGVPQTRKRAFLIASRVRKVAPPAPTHTAWGDDHEPDGLFGSRLLPWVSMADALGWGMTERPSMTVTGGGTGAGGAKDVRPQCPLRHRAGERERGAWVMRASRRPTPPSAGPTSLRPRSSADTTRPTGCGCTATTTRPTRRSARRPTSTDGPLLGAVEQGRLGAWTQPGPSGSPSSRPPCCKASPPSYPWQGSRTAQYRQVGDAVPPPLAMHVLSAATGVPVPAERRGVAA